MKKLFASLLLVSASANSYAQIDGNMLHQLCSSTSESNKTSCSLYIRGVLDASIAIEAVHKIPRKQQLMCMPGDVTFSQMIDVAKNYLRDHPEERHKGAMALIVNSMAKFDCE